MTQGFNIARVPMSQVDTGDQVQSPLGVIFRVHGKAMSWGEKNPFTWTLTSEDGSQKIQGNDDTLVNKVVRA